MIAGLGVVRSGAGAGAGLPDGVFIAAEHGGLGVAAAEMARPGAEDAAGFMALVCAVAEARACVPMRAVREGAEVGGLRSMLESGASRFDRLLGLIEGCDEWSIRVEGARAEGEGAGGGDEPGAQAGDRPGDRPGGGAGYLALRRRAYAEREGVDPRVAALGGAVARALGGACRAWRVIGATNAGLGEVALLLSRERSSWALDAVDGALAVAGAWGVVTGPWPAFSFVGHEAGALASV